MLWLIRILGFYGWGIVHYADITHFSPIHQMASIEGFFPPILGHYEQCWQLVHYYMLYFLVEMCYLYIHCTILYLTENICYNGHFKTSNGFSMWAILGWMCAA